jgi:hypothetical protein
MIAFPQSMVLRCVLIPIAEQDIPVGLAGRALANHHRVWPADLALGEGEADVYSPGTEF